ncbi:hypothetical protein [Acinetobacter sp. TGL-Y2]|uniref:hypothetical protein n=1 Tax=Acinetobacter TaxID=469 RepID=UPI001907A149|nr:hypothetical protein [Acinetobacter sp. TGL-Y2]MBJ9372084.1 hypothetical protein [Acinetobacter sp. TGL-Y2]
MKKYITLIAGILVSTHIYAESYVFGGKAQFLGALLNQSCSISIESIVDTSTRAPQSPIQINFSTCSVDYYSNLIISLSEPNQLKKEMFTTTAQTKSEFDKEINIQSAEHKRLGEKFIQHIDLPKHYDDESPKSVRVYLNKSFEDSPTQAPHFLISIFYP